MSETELLEHAESCEASARAWHERGAPALAMQLERTAQDSRIRAAHARWRNDRAEAEAVAAELMEARAGAAPSVAAAGAAIDSNDDEAERAVFKVVPCDDLATATVAPVQFVIERIIPRGEITLFGGHGGIGKSTTALALAAHVAAGRAWNGLSVAQGRALIVSLEDRADIARWRLRQICAAYGLDAADVGRSVAILDGAAVADTALTTEAIVDGRRKIIGTAALAQIQTAAKGCALVILDGASDAFSGNEIDRGQVTRFLRKLATELARQSNAGVVLVAHIDKAAARFGSNGNSYSGSTAWHNAVRSRLALIAVEGGAVELHHEKTSHGKLIAAVPLRMDDRGVLIPRAAGEQADADTGAALVEQGDADALYAALVAAGEQGATVPTGRTGPATAQHVLSTLQELPQALRGPKGRPRFWNAMANLQRAGRAGFEDYVDSSRHRRQRIVARVPA